MQFQFSVCMYGTCGRIDNKADFDFDFFDFDLPFMMHWKVKAAFLVQDITET